jgi:multiple sugar transport system permease protein
MTTTQVRPGHKRNRRKAAITGWLFILPVIFGIFAFQIGPIFISLFASFTSWDGLTSPKFVGGSNYTNMVKDPLFGQTLRNTLLFVVGAIPLTVVIALILAVLLQSRGLKGRAFFRTAYFTPYVTSSVAIGLVWFQLYAPHGILNDGLSKVGIAGPAWLSDTFWAMPAVIIVAVWQGVGYPMVILISGLQGIDATLYEAASLDRASTWRQFWSITLPMLTPQLFFVLITQFIASFQIFAIIFVMTKGGPGNATNVIIYYLYQNAFTFGRLGYASAMAWFLFLVIGLVTFVQWRLQKRWVFYG